ncbi:MAG: DedA family protein [Acidobacteria bacterium]|nr:DedA family protein [Acidobacteriota bacterium]MCW5949581.1 DedA family protein [Pyrinomonadaceae bacterium]
MEQHLHELIETYGVYAVFALCMVEGDITLLISGVLANSSFFGQYSFAKVFIFGTLGAVAGDCIGYFIGLRFHHVVKGYRFYQLTQPRIEKLIDKFGGFAIIISKYIYGIRVAMCLFYGIGRMPFWRFLLLDFISCGTWVLVLSGVGYFFSGAVTSIIGDFRQIGIALFFIVLFGIVFFYILERFWLSEKVEEANPETIHKLEEKLLAVEDIGKTTLHDLTERLHLTRDASRDEADPQSAKKPAKSDTEGPHVADR